MQNYIQWDCSQLLLTLAQHQSLYWSLIPCKNNNNTPNSSYLKPIASVIHLGSSFLQDWNSTFLTAKLNSVCELYLPLVMRIICLLPNSWRLSEIATLHSTQVLRVSPSLYIFLFALCLQIHSALKVVFIFASSTVLQSLLWDLLQLRACQKVLSVGFCKFIWQSVWLTIWRTFQSKKHGAKPWRKDNPNPQGPWYVSPMTLLHATTLLQLSVLLNLKHSGTRHSKTWWNKHLCICTEESMKAFACLWHGPIPVWFWLRHQRLSSKEKRSRYRDLQPPGGK